MNSHWRHPEPVHSAVELEFWIVLSGGAVGRFKNVRMWIVLFVSYRKDYKLSADVLEVRKGIIIKLLGFLWDCWTSSVLCWGEMICLQLVGSFFGDVVSQGAGLRSNQNLKDFQLELVVTNHHLTFQGSVYWSPITKKDNQSLRQDDWRWIPRSSGPDASPFMCRS